MENIDQTNYDQDHCQFKIRTPASLFSKQRSRSPKNIRNMSVSQIGNSCENHHQKEGNFFTLSNGEHIYFCQKCAITLASQGHTISKVQSSTKIPSPSILPSNSRVKRQPKVGRNSREAEMTQFLNSLRDIRSTLGSSKQSIRQKLIESEQFYGQQLQQINEYFSLMIKSLQLQKHKCYNHILKQRQNAEVNIRELDNRLMTIDEDVTRILMDIEDNFQTVYSIDEDMYKMVLGQYRAQQEEFQHLLGELLLMPIQMRKIQFQGVPESIYNISDCVIQNSINSQQQYRLADSLSASDLTNLQAISPRQTDRDNTPYRQINQGQNLKFSFQGQRLRAQRRELGSSKKYLCCDQ